MHHLALTNIGWNGVKAACQAGWFESGFLTGVARLKNFLLGPVFREDGTEKITVPWLARGQGVVLVVPAVSCNAGVVSRTLSLSMCPSLVRFLDHFPPPLVSMYLLSGRTNWLSIGCVMGRFGSIYIQATDQEYFSFFLKSGYQHFLTILKPLVHLGTAEALSGNIVKIKNYIKLSVRGLLTVLWTNFNQIWF